MKDWGVAFPAPKIDIDKLRARKEKVIDTLSGASKTTGPNGGMSK